MKKAKHHILNHHTDQIVFEGWFHSMKDCVERAVADGINLDGADLAGINLACANLDDAQMAGARLAGANLNGANLSEGVFDNADFARADLSYACLAVSSFMGVDFHGSSFAATDVTDAVIRDCMFSCPSMFTCLWHRAAVFSDCIYSHDERTNCALTKPPVMISGLPRDIVYMDNAVRIGNDVVAKKDLANAGYAHLKFLYGEAIARFLLPVLREAHISA